VSKDARFLFKPLGCDYDRKIIDSITRFHREGKPIYAYNIGLDCGLDPSIVSRWFRDHGIFWDCWRKSWVAVIVELAAPVLETLPEGAIKTAAWVNGGYWLRRGVRA
jgi:hypothetical protein